MAHYTYPCYFFYTINTGNTKSRKHISKKSNIAFIVSKKNYPSHNNNSLPLPCYIIHFEKWTVDNFEQCCQPFYSHLNFSAFLIDYHQWTGVQHLFANRNTKHTVPLLLFYFWSMLKFFRFFNFSGLSKRPQFINFKWSISSSVLHQMTSEQIKWRHSNHVTTTENYWEYVGGSKEK